MPAKTATAPPPPEQLSDDAQRQAEEDAKAGGDKTFLDPDAATQVKAPVPSGTVWERMAAITAELPAIGKTTENTQQHFMYRSHDAVLNALNPLLAKYQIVVVPHAILERITDQRPTRSGGVMYEVNLLVQYRFYGPDGDHIEGMAWGEGTDSGDKATNKAMTMAFKNVLAQSFAVSTADTVDSDGTSDEATTGRASAQAYVAQSEDVLKAKPPANWSDALKRFDKAVGGDGNAAAWLEELLETRWQVTSVGDLEAADRRVCSTGFFSALMFLEDTYGEHLAFMVGARAAIQAAFAMKFEGLRLEGPAWALDAKEAEEGRLQQSEMQVPEAGAPEKEGGDAPAEQSAEGSG